MIPRLAYIKVRPTPSGLTRAYPAANWLKDTVTIVRLRQAAPNQGTLDVLDVQTKAGDELAIYDFNIIGRA